MTYKKYKKVRVFYDYSIYCCSATPNSNSEFFKQKGQNYRVVILLQTFLMLEINCLML